MRLSRRNVPVIVYVVLAAAGVAAQQAAIDTGQTVALNGIQMYYEEHGQGEPLFLLHGFGGSGSAWEPWVTELAKRYRVIVPDLRGHGHSTNPTNEFTHRQSARDMFALMDKLGIKRKIAQSAPPIMNLKSPDATKSNSAPPPPTSSSSVSLSDAERQQVIDQVKSGVIARLGPGVDAAVVDQIVRKVVGKL